MLPHPSSCEAGCGSSNPSTLCAEVMQKPICLKKQWPWNVSAVVTGFFLLLLMDQFLSERKQTEFMVCGKNYSSNTAVFQEQMHKEHWFSTENGSIKSMMFRCFIWDQAENLAVGAACLWKGMSQSQAERTNEGACAAGISLGRQGQETAQWSLFNDRWWSTSEDLSGLWVRTLQNKPLGKHSFVKNFRAVRSRSADGAFTSFSVILAGWFLVCYNYFAKFKQNS